MKPSIVTLLLLVFFSCADRKENYVDFLNKKPETHYSDYTDKYKYI
jgi:hypothetical protein